MDLLTTCATVLAITPLYLNMNNCKQCRRSLQEVQSAGWVTSSGSIISIQGQTGDLPLDRDTVCCLSLQLYHQV